MFSESGNPAVEDGQKTDGRRFSEIWWSKIFRNLTAVDFEKSGGGRFSEMGGPIFPEV